VVVLAVPGGAAAGLLADPPAAQTRFLGTVRYNRLGIVHYAIAGDIPPVMRFITPAESSVLSTYQQMAAGGRPHAQLYCQLSPEASREDGPMEPMIREDVRRQFPDLDRRVIGHSEQRIVHKLPVPYPGYLAALAGYRTWQEAAPRRVYLCGDYMGSPLLGGACASGVRAADAVMRHWGG
jgi:oxygen-dependent protoporphyrinogen oxidase